MPTTQRIEYNRYGGPELMHLAAFTPPDPGRGELVVEVIAAAVNPMDWRIRNGDTRFMTGRKFPRGLGHDFAGIVTAIGPEVTRFAVGDEVLGATSLKASGAFSNLVTAEESQLVTKPETLSFAEAAVLPTVGVTAWQALFDRGRLTAGQTVFINGCLGGVGRAAAQLASMRGASVAGSCRPGTHDAAKALGITPVLSFDFDPAQLSKHFDLVFDTAGTLTYAGARTMLKPRGRIVDINGTPAKMARSAMPGPFNVLIAKYTAEDLGQVSRAAADGALHLPIADTVPLTQAIPALTELETKHAPRQGKVVITMQP